MKKCGLLGEKLSHSYSPYIHGMLGKYEYALFEKSREDVEEFIKQGDFDGINVTIPYKKVAFALCDEVSDEAKRLGNVNTVVRRKDGSLFGTNTDYYGFCYTVKRSGVSVFGKKAIVLGSGGASSTVCVVLRELGAKEVTVISRNGEDNYENLEKHYDAEIIVNATPVGMYPKTDSSLIELERFGKCVGVFDVIYNPAKTKLLLDAERLGIAHENGLAMLVAQAKASAEYFAGEKIEDSEIERMLKKLSADMKNIILVGMPGSGKSTIGKLIAEESKRRFVDIDEYIARKAGISIPQIFEKSGEEGFRRLETQALREVCRESSLVIATGGGCVTREENYPALHQNGTIIWIKRELSDLAKEGRPLSQGNLNEMYERRKPMYEWFCDFEVTNEGNASDVARKCLDIIK